MCQAFQSNGAKLGQQHELKMQLAPLASVLRPLAHAGFPNAGAWKPRLGDGISSNWLMRMPSMSRIC